MNVETILTWCDSAADWWGIVLLHSLWIATLVAIVIVVICNRRIARSADVRYVVVLVALLSIPVASMAAASFSSSLSDTDNVATVVSNGATHAALPVLADSTSTNPPSVAPLNSAAFSADAQIDSQVNSRRLLTALWGIGVAIMLMRIVRSHVAANRIKLSATDAIPDWLDELFGQLKQQVGRVGHVSLRTADAVAVPMVYGFLRPVVLLPISAVSGLSEESLKVILVHELAHVRRGDLWFSFVERLIEAFFFFHPAVWWLLRVLQTEREVCCDAIAAEVVGQRLDVAAALVNSVEAISSVRSGNIGNVALAAGGGDLEDRVERLVDPAKTPKLSVTVSSLILLSGIGLLGILFLTVSTASVAVQVQKALSPQEQVAAVAEAIESAMPEQENFVRTKETVSGRVVLSNGSDELPVRTNICLVYKSGNASGSISMTVDEDGVFTNTVPAPGVVHALVQSDGFAPSLFGPFDFQNAPLDLGNLPLSKGFSSRLKLVDNSGAPIAGAVVESASIEIYDGNAMGSRSGIRGKSTDANGTLDIEHCADVSMRLQVRKPGFEVDRKTLRWKLDETIQWQLKNTAPAIGQILDEAGQPIVGVDVYPYQQTKPINNSYSPRERFLETYGSPRRPGLGRTDEEGRFQLTSLRSDSEYIFMALVDNRQPLLIYDAKPGADLKTLVMKPPIQVSGRIKGDLTKIWQPPWNENRAFTYSNPVRLRDGSSGPDSGLYGFVSPDGTFTLPQLFPGTVSLHLNKRSFVVDNSKPQTALEFDLDAEVQPWHDLLRPVEITFQPPDARLLRGTISVGWQRPKGSTGNIPSNRQQMFRLNDPRDRNRTSDAKVENQHGLQVTPVDGNVIKWAAPPGAKIWLEGRDLVGAMIKPEWHPAVPDGEEPHRITVPVDPAGAVTGRFVDSDGQPVTKFQLHIRGRLDGNRLPFTKLETIEHADGRFAMGPLPLNGRHEFCAYLSDQTTWQAAVFGPFQITDSQPVVKMDVKLPAPTALRGVVVDVKGNPLPDSVVGLSIRTNGNGSLPHQFAHSVGRSLTTDADGRFSIKAAAVPIDATMLFSVRPQKGHCGHGQTFASNAFPSGGDLGTIKLQPGLTLTGQVVDESGAPMQRVSVALSRRDSRRKVGWHESASTNASGHFELHGVEHNERVHLRSYTHELVSVTKPFVLPPSPADDRVASWENTGTRDREITIVVQKK